MQSFTIFGTVPGFRIHHVYRNLESNEHLKQIVDDYTHVLLDDSLITLPPNSSNLFLISRINLPDNERLVWVGLYRYLPREGLKRESSLYGAGVWLFNTMITGELIVPVLNKAVDSLEGLIPKYFDGPWDDISTVNLTDINLSENILQKISSSELKLPQFKSFQSIYNRKVCYIDLQSTNNNFLSKYIYLAQNHEFYNKYKTILLSSDCLIKESVRTGYTFFTKPGDEDIISNINDEKKQRIDEPKLIRKPLPSLNIEESNDDNLKLENMQQSHATSSIQPRSWSINDLDDLINAHIQPLNNIQEKKIDEIYTELDQYQKKINSIKYFFVTYVIFSIIAGCGILLYSINFSSRNINELYSSLESLKQSIDTINPAQKNSTKSTIPDKDLKITKDGGNSGDAVIQSLEKHPLSAKKIEEIQRSSSRAKIYLSEIRDKANEALKQLETASPEVSAKQTETTTK